jgi:hypothetical protein
VSTDADGVTDGTLEQGCEVCGSLGWVYVEGVVQRCPKECAPPENLSALSLHGSPTETHTYEELFDYPAVWPWVPQSAVASPRVPQENDGLSITENLYPEEQKRYNDQWKQVKKPPPPPPQQDTYSTDVKEITDAEYADTQE